MSPSRFSPPACHQAINRFAIKTSTSRDTVITMPHEESEPEIPKLYQIGWANHTLDRVFLMGG